MKEEEIRPKKIFEEYLELCRKDVESFFRGANYQEINCPACDSKGHFVFDKHGFKYQRCSDCETIFVSPRPPLEAFDRYYRDSPSTRYWATTFYKETLEMRKEKMWKPKAAMIQKILKAREIEPLIVDIGAGYGVFADVMKETTSYPLLLIEPSVHLAKILREKGYEVLEQSLESLTPGQIVADKSCFVSFELFEHLYDPGHFLQQLYEIMKTGDLFIFTALSSTGIDLQTLWKDSNSISPPHHLNFLNPWALDGLLTKVGFVDVEITTPGKLDVDILSNNQDLISDRFLKVFFKYCDQDAKTELQSLLVKSKFSSHMMIVCEKG